MSSEIITLLCLAVWFLGMGATAGICWALFGDDPHTPEICVVVVILWPLLMPLLAIGYAAYRITRRFEKQ